MYCSYSDDHAVPLAASMDEVACMSVVMITLSKLWVCDPVAGTAHLRTSRAQARAIARGVTRRLGGLAVPRFVADEPGMPHKMPV